MYDPRGEFLPPHGGTVQFDPEDLYPYPTIEALGAWDPDGLGFVPRPRTPVDDPGPSAAGPAVPSVPRHRRRARLFTATWSQVLGSLFGVLTAVTVIAVCVLGWLLSYDPLRDLAFTRVPRGLSQLWPLIVYGPWLVGCLSVLRAALDGRRPMHSWVVVVVFSTVATGLCVADVSHTAPDVIVAGLPPITAVVSLHQLVRQLLAGKGTHRHASHKAAPVKGVRR
ncbi:DUF2637 domain-containing protein [Kitasatospora sp. NPDC052896]|uniref:DUF2637 domain-containing protein n=1 Tax=Kitasatospora sp. NPDC052896 TaxID=3364061 RepID=UPI0037CB0BE8